MGNCVSCSEEQCGGLGKRGRIGAVDRIRNSGRGGAGIPQKKALVRKDGRPTDCDHLGHAGLKFSAGQRVDDVHDQHDVA